MWSQVEDRATTFTVMIMLTRGEASGACVDVGGKGSEACADARLSSWVEFFTQMSQHDPTIPAYE
ncbi:hypothetical protein K0651_06240 [Ornithinimicrobium sp. Arc0846-15]|nr:hypothetical protein [Ornithinimicrobium laminariae]